MSHRVIVTHGSCPDGEGAAYWLGKHIGEHTLVHGKYGPAEREELLYAGADVYFTDFAWEPDDLRWLETIADRVTVLDHHETSLGWLQEVGWIIHPDAEGLLDDMFSAFVAVHDQQRSGIGLAARFVKAAYGQSWPKWFDNIEDRDLWRFADPHTKDVFAAVTSYPYTVEAWDRLCEMDQYELALEGRAIERYRQQLIEQVVATAREAEVAGFKHIWLVECPYAIASDVAGILAERDPYGFAAYRIIKQDSVQYGLRSAPSGMNVAKIAERFGGGGHPRAAGFTVPNREEGA